MSKAEGTYKHGRTVAEVRASGRRVKLLRNVKSSAGRLLVGAGTLGYAETPVEGKALAVFDGQAVVRPLDETLLRTVEHTERRPTERKAARGHV